MVKEDVQSSKEPEINRLEPVVKTSQTDAYSTHSIMVRAR